MHQTIYNTILKNKANGKKQFAILIDPDKFKPLEIIHLAEGAKVDFILVGGSLLSTGDFKKCINTLKEKTKIPIVIFPGNNLQISNEADAILLLSLISGRNADLLIGKHVIAAPILKRSNLEVMPTGYMLIESGKQTTALYMSNTNPIPYDKDDIAMCTALAGEQLGLKLIYMDAGSGAAKPVTESMIKEVSTAITIPVIVGGGINSVENAVKACKAGADVIVIGNAIEKSPHLITEISTAIHSI